ncbi:hypothetical protein C2E20_4164 [Micractinium conductrix]|uniref:Uncharacterized protein n=1 Tax=Micractinium conductrix TaxID=554055 RepID=A0A2P6VEC9_9CHLO|nr:hypothetical protein C2E20_4164 [Micractinium conductrix]|eukprot:PSC72453.1 hypothetical protein C2E20_4164 [Micractinium conductrix]
MPKRAAVAAPEGAAAPKGFVPDPSLRPVSIEQPKLDVSAAAPGGDQELWLLQLPIDFPANAEADWQVSDDAMDGFRGRCTVQGVDYLLLPDNEALSSDLYATPAGAHGALVPVVRRMTVVRATSAPQLCFGQSEAEAQLAGAAAPGAPGQRPLAPAGGKPGKRPRAAQQQQAQQATAEQPHAAAPPPPPQQQQPESGKKKKKEKRRKGEAEAPAGIPTAAATAPAAAAAPPPAAAAEAVGTEKKKEKKEKKDKSAKKGKKEKKEKKKDRS